MKTVLRIFLQIFVVSFVLFFVWNKAMGVIESYIGNKNLQNAQKISKGMNMAEVIEIMGEPDFISYPKENQIEYEFTFNFDTLDFRYIYISFDQNFFVSKVSTPK